MSASAATAKGANDLLARLAIALETDWRSNARPEQLAPAGEWTTWIFCAGRGAGKTRSGAEWVQERVVAGSRFVHLIAPTAADVRSVMLEGPAGLLTVAAKHLRPEYSPTQRKLTWPNGAVGFCFSADEPDRLRGPQCDTLWIDELCAMRLAQDVVDMAYFGLRVGKDPRALITTTPRPIKPFRALLAREGQDVVVSRSSTLANAANLAKPFLNQIITKYQGTRLGRQEIEAEVLTDTPGALWHLEQIEAHRVREAPPLERVVVAIDPAVSYGPDSDETGIIVAGRAADGRGYVLDDLSGRYPPEEWARRAIMAYRQYSADRIVAEVNQGGALVESTLRSVDPAIPYSAVHASRGKMTRAEPVSALYEQGRVHHVGMFGPLEDQQTGYDGARNGPSPDRLDALCWAIHELMLGEPEGLFIKPPMLLRSHEAAREPIDTPTCCGRLAVSVAGCVADPDAIGTIFFALPLPDEYADSSRPLAILEWDLTRLEAGALDAWAPQVHARLAALTGICRPNFKHLLVIESAGIGPTLAERAISHKLTQSVELAYIKDHTFGTASNRIVKASGHVSGGKVQLTRTAHEHTQDFKSVRRNHLLAQVAAFGVSQDTPAMGELLIAFANGVQAKYDTHHGPTDF